MSFTPSPQGPPKQAPQTPSQGHHHISAFHLLPKWFLYKSVLIYKFLSYSMQSSWKVLLNGTWLKMFIYILLSKISPQTIMPWGNLQQEQSSVALSTGLQIPSSSKTSQTRANWLLCHTEHGQSLYTWHKARTHCSTPVRDCTALSFSWKHTEPPLETQHYLSSKILTIQCRQCCWAFSCNWDPQKMEAQYMTA